MVSGLENRRSSGLEAHYAALIGEAAVAANQGVACNALPEHLHAQHISYELLSFLHSARSLFPSYQQDLISLILAHLLSPVMHTVVCDVNRSIREPVQGCSWGMQASAEIHDNSRQTGTCTLSMSGWTRAT